MSKLQADFCERGKKQRARSQRAVLNHHSQTVNINAVISNVRKFTEIFRSSRLSPLPLSPPFTSTFGFQLSKLPKVPF